MPYEQVGDAVHVVPVVVGHEDPHQPEAPAVDLVLDRPGIARIDHDHGARGVDRPDIIIFQGRDREDVHRRAPSVWSGRLATGYSSPAG